MESHVGILTDDLSKYITNLESGSYPHLKLQYQYDDKTYYSVIMQACGGYFIEALSTSEPSMHDTSDFVFTEEPRFDWNSRDFTDSDIDTVVKVSRATAMISEMVKFYTETIGGKVVKNGTSSDGTEWAVVKLDSAVTQLFFVNRPAPSGAKFTVADLETMINSVHDKYIKSPNCGFDQYADHHWAYDAPMS